MELRTQEDISTLLIDVHRRDVAEVIPQVRKIPLCDLGNAEAGWRCQW